MRCRSGRVRCRPARSARTGSPPARSGDRACSVPNVTVRRRPDRVAGCLSGVGHHPGRQVDREDRDGPRSRRRRPGRPADPAAPGARRCRARRRRPGRPRSGHDRRSRRPSTSRPPAASSARQTRLVRLPEGADGGHRAAPAGQPLRRRTARRRRCCRARPRSPRGRRTTVPRVRASRSADADREPVGGALHQRRRHRPPPWRPLPGHGSGRPCTRSARTQPSQTTIAEAIPASWDSDRWTCRTPRAPGPVLDRRR